MPIDENSLTTLLESQISTVAGHRVFTLTPGLGLPVVETLIEKFLPGENGAHAALTITADATPSTEPFTFSGKISSLFGVARDFEVTAEFRVADGDAQLRLTIDLPQDWKFSTGFFAPITAAGEEFLFDGLTLRNAQLILDSKGDADAGLSIGVNFRGTVQLTGPLETVGWLLSDTGAVEVSGGISFTESGRHPEMDLSFQSGGTRQVGQLQLGFALHLGTKFLAEKNVLDASFRLVTALNPPLRGATAPLTLIAEFRRSAGSLVFQASLGAGISTSLAELSFLANGAELPALLPDGFDVGRPSLSTLRFVVDTNQRKLTSIELALASQKSWKIIDQVAVNAIFLDLQVSDPADSTKRQITCSVGGTIHLGSNASLDVGAEFPAFDVHGTLVDGPANLTSAVAAILPGNFELPPGMPDFPLSKLDVALNPRERTLEFHAATADTFRWTIVPDLIAVKAIKVDFNASQAGSKTLVSGDISGLITLGDPSTGAGLDLEVSAAVEEKLLVEAHFVPDPGDPPVSLTSLLQHFIPGAKLPGTDATTSALTLRQLDFKASPRFSTFTLTAEVDNVLRIDDNFALQSLGLELDFAPQRKLLFKLTGQVQIFGASLTVSAEQTDAGWKIEGLSGPITLDQIVHSTLLQNLTTTPVVLPESVASLGLAHIGFTVETTSGKTSITVDGALKHWTLPLAGGQSIEVDAALSIEASKLADGSKSSTASISGDVSFTNFADAEFFKHIRVTAESIFGATPEIHLTLALGKLVLSATYTSASTPVLTFTIGATTGLTIGDLLTGMVNLVDPDVEDFQLDEPWDQLCSINLGSPTFTLNLTTKAFSVTSKFSLDLKFAKIDGLTLTYAKGAAGKPSRLTIKLEGNILGQPIEAWDPIGEAAPKVAGHGSSVFDLKYLGLGQHVSFPETTLRTFTNISSVMQALQDDLKPLPPPESTTAGVPAALTLPGPLIFSGTSQWLIGAEFKVADTVALKIIFNDPVLYGLRLELSGDKAKKFAGLEFEILYRRISDTLGVYHAELTLPDYVRQLEFGAVAVTLPDIVLDIYTNGDFKLDVGFPWNGNFDRSFAVQVLPFTGAGGFYFNKLSAETATSVPVVPAAVGSFNPVIEFGIGVRMGLGKSFSKGPLRAELSIVFQGILEGVIAWFHSSAVGGPTGQYYLIHGAISLVGRIYGAVDFEVIRVDVEVIVKVTVQFRVEAYQPIVIELTAEVSVRASITILFITVHFSFSLTVSQKFTLPALETGTAPWQIAGGGSHLALESRFAPKRVVRLSAPGAGITWKALTIWSAKQTIELVFQPVFTLDGTTTKGIALLFLENSIPPAAVDDSEHAAAAASTDTDFDVLAQALLAWAVYSFRMDDAPAAGSDLALDIQNFTVTLQDLQDLQDALAGTVSTTPPPPPPKFALSALLAFLEANFAIDVKTQAAGAGASSLTAFPVFPDFKLKVGDADPAAFTAVAGNLFVDYFFLIVRTAVQYAVDELADVVAAVKARPPLEQLAAKLLDSNGTITLATAQAILPAGFDTAAAAANSSLSDDQWKAILTTNPQTGTTLATLRANLQAAVPAVGGVAPQLSASDVVVAISANPALKFSGTLNVAAWGYNPVIPDTAALNTSGETLAAAVVRLQSAAESAVDTKSFGYSLQGVLSRLNRGGQLNHLAGISSRFLLHGVRRAAGAATQALFEATGQEFPFAAGSTVELRKPDAPTFVTFPNSADKLSYSLSDAAADVARLTGDFPAAPVANISPYYGVEPRRFANSHYLPWDFPIVEISQSLQAFLQEKGSVPATELSLYTETRPAGGAPVRTPITNFAWATKINLTIRQIPEDGVVGTYVLSGASSSDNDLIEDLWNQTQPQTATNPPTLRILFAADGAGGKLTSGPPSNYRLLKANLAAYGARPSDMTDDARPSLTAEAETGLRLYSATLSEPAGFLRLVWESGAVTGGGYFLHSLPGTDGAAAVLPAKLFPDQRTGSVVLLIEGAAANAHSFHNCVIVRDTGANFDETPLMVESVVTDTVFTGKSGHIGFSAVRDDASLPRGHLNEGAVLRKTPTADGAPVTVPAGTTTFIVTRRSADGAFLQLTGASDARLVRGWVSSSSFTQDQAGLGALSNLYQILAYRITSPTLLNPVSKDLKASANGAEWQYDPAAGGMPVGPASQSPSVDEDEGRWTYERAIPVFRLFTSGGQVDLSADPDHAKLPAPDANPYAGIGQDVSLEFRWRDVYGYERPESSSLVLHVRYFDPLIGIHQWPSTKTAYVFDKDTAGATRLRIRLSFDPSAFQRDPDARARALDTYRTVFYQVHQSDVTFQLTSSQMSASKVLDATQIRTYVRQAYLHLAALQDTTTTVPAVQDTPAPVPALQDTTTAVPAVQDQTLAITFTSAELSTPATLATAVNVKIGITRPEDKVDAGAAAVAKTISSSIAPNTADFYTTIVTSGQSLGDVATALSAALPNTNARHVVSSGTIVAQNQDTPGLIAANKPLFSTAPDTVQLARSTALTATQWGRIKDAGINTKPGETFGTLLTKLSAALGGTTVPVTLDDLTAAIVTNNDLLVVGQTVQVAVTDLAGFAAKFQTAFPGQFLATAGEGGAQTPAAPGAVAALFAVPLANTKDDPGIFYKIRDIQESVPLYFAPTPVANTLQSGTVNIDTYAPGTGITASAAKSQRFDSIDVNVLARDLLVAVEAFLDPAVAIPAFAASQSAVTAMLGHKEKLADAIYNDVTHIVTPPASVISGDTLAKRRTVAANLLRRQLLVNLVEGFDVEAVIQSSVDVKVTGVATAASATFATAPRLVGLPVLPPVSAAGAPGTVSPIHQSKTGTPLVDEKGLTFTLSPAEAPLRQTESYLTFLFDTRTPEKYEGVSLDLDFRVNQLEYDIVNIDGANAIGQYQSSSWLTFVLPIDGTGADTANRARHRIGEMPMIIPLRTYPVPPSLVSQQILADPDSLERVEDIREWDYQFTYSHPDIAQDAVNSSVRFNLSSTSEGVSVPAGPQLTAPADLFSALLNFSQVYRVLWPDLQQQLKATPIPAGAARICADLAALVGTAATAWENRARALSTTNGQSAVAGAGELRYEIEEPTGSLVVVPKALGGAAAPGPNVEVGGYRLVTVDADGKRTFARLAESAAAPAGIPDRTVTIAGFDIIEKQNAWAAVWLERNGQLLDDAASNPQLQPRLAGFAVNPVFHFQTPPVRFNSLLTPLLVNDREWDVATFGAGSGVVTITPAARSPFDAGTALAFNPAQAVTTERALRAGQASIGVTKSATAPGGAALFIARGSRFTLDGDPQVYNVDRFRSNPQSRTLDAHLETLFATLLPASSTQPYEVQVACSYAFPLTPSDAAEPDLLATLPVLLSTRFAVAAGLADTQFRNGLVKNLVAGIDAFGQNHPIAANASYFFSVSIFASNGGNAELAPPLLRIEKLRLRLADIRL